MEIEQIKRALYQSLIGSGWAYELRTFFLSAAFDCIIEQLLSLKKTGKRFTPPLKYIFRAFQNCNISSLKVVMVGGDPYPALHCSDGILFSGGNMYKPQRTLDLIFQEVQRTIYPDSSDYTPCTDLVRWSEQGVLMLHTALTSELGHGGKHFGIWQDFTAHLMDILNLRYPGLVWVFFGAHAYRYAELISDKHTKFFCSHPAGTLYTDGKYWNSEDVFNKINLQLRSIGKTPVVW